MSAYECVFWISALLFLASIFYPWHPEWPLAKWLVHSPLFLIPLWIWYELAMPNYMNIRLDVPLIMVAVTVAMVLYVVRLVLFALFRRE